MKNWTLIGLLPLMAMTACDSSDNSGRDFENDPVEKIAQMNREMPSAPTPKDLQNPIPTLADQTKEDPYRPSILRTYGGCSDVIQPLSDRFLNLNSLSALHGYSYHLTELRIGQTRSEIDNESQIRFAWLNPIFKDNLSRPEVECIQAKDKMRDMSGSFDFPIYGDTIQGSSGKLVKHKWQLLHGSVVENETSNSILKSSFEMNLLRAYFAKLSRSGFDFKVYAIDQHHFQVFGTLTNVDSGWLSKTRASMVYEYYPILIENDVSVQAPSPAPTQAVKNRCGVDYPYVTIDKRQAFYGSSDTDRFNTLDALTTSGFCNSNSKLSVDFPYIQISGKSAFHFSNATEGVKALLDLYKANAGTPQTARCGADYPYVTIDSQSSFDFSNIKDGVQRLISLISNGTCTP